MVDEAVEEFNDLPKVVMPNGSEVPVTADVDIHTISLQPFNHFIQSDQYYDGNSLYSSCVGAPNILNSLEH